MASVNEIHNEVVRQAQELARIRFAEIQLYIQDFPMEAAWPFHPGDYPWLLELAKQAIEAGLIPELAPATDPSGGRSDSD